MVERVTFLILIPDTLGEIIGSRTGYPECAVFLKTTR
jgi:hypothetical protein